MKRTLISNGNPLEDVIGFSRAVRVGSFISIGGTAPVDSDGKTVGVGDIKVQTRKCIEIIQDALQQAGSDLKDVVRTRMILTDMSLWKDAITVRSEFFQNIKPVDTVMEVSRFINDEWLIEIEVDAIITK